MTRCAAAPPLSAPQGLTHETRKAKYTHVEFGIIILHYSLPPRYLYTTEKSLPLQFSALSTAS